MVHLKTHQGHSQVSEGRCPTGLCHGVLPVLLTGAATLVHQAHGLLQRAHKALGRILPRLVLADLRNPYLNAQTTRYMSNMLQRRRRPGQT
eukprot:349305-Pleurochrysis_carterae.AAC.1